MQGLWRVVMWAAVVLRLSLMNSDYLRAIARLVAVAVSAVLIRMFSIYAFYS